jgi:hypothetical protein
VTQHPVQVSFERVTLENRSLDDLLQGVSSAGKVLFWGTAVGDVNTFTMETDDGRIYTVSQIEKGGGARLFYFLDTPRDFTVTQISTQPGSESFSMSAGLRVRWTGKVGDGWINSNALYVGRVELRFGDPKHFAKIRGKMALTESQDRELPKKALGAALHSAGGLLPPAGQAP